MDAIRQKLRDLANVMKLLQATSTKPTVYFFF